ncbi:MAG: HAD family acid phosphatase [Bdellovibrionota bacterium]
MKTLNLKVIALALSLLAPALSALAQDHNPAALSQVVENVKRARAEGKQPVVMFDLDDTLINTRERTLRIIKDFLKQQQLPAGVSSEEAQKLANLQVSDIRFLMGDTLKEQGIQNPALAKALGDAFLAKFFTNEFCANDQQNPGAARYAREIVRAGGKVIYLTGRDAPRMQSGTLENLRKQGFPVSSPEALLLMKPDKSLDDLQFKKDSFALVGGMGEMEGVFENEPANVNAMADAFPSATAIFLDTIHSPTDIVPEARVSSVTDFFHPDAYGSNETPVQQDAGYATAAY